MARALLCLSLLAVGVGFVRSRTLGAPLDATVCNKVQPGSYSPHIQQSGNGNYFISSNIPLNTTAQFYKYTAGQNYTVQVQGISETTFRGFLVQAWSPDTTRIGKFVIMNQAQQQLLDCSSFSVPAMATITHINSRGSDFTVQTFEWIAPDSDGLVNFMYSVVRSRSEYFGTLNAADLPQQSLTIQDPITDAPSIGIPTTVTDPVRSAEDYRITVRFPSNCVASECSVFVGVDTNTGEDTYLDVYMEGIANAWVAVGFTKSASMFSADVLACNVNSDNMVEALDTWNDDRARSNFVDVIQNSYLFSGTFINGRIKCTLVREIAGSEVSVRDFNLASSYFLLFGRGMISSAGSLTAHDFGITGNPQISSDMVNPTLDKVKFGSNIDKVRSSLTRAHGIFMWVAWPFLATTGIFFAIWMRPALPNGEWFKVHRALMMASLSVGSIGFFFIFVAQLNQPIQGLITLGKNNRVGTAHFVFGIIVMCLQIVNPLIALFRCHPGTPNRWIFNYVHGYGIGLVVEALAFINVGIGISIFNELFSFAKGLNFFYLFVVYVVFLAVMSTILPFIYQFTSKTGNVSDDGKTQPDENTGQTATETIKSVEEKPLNVSPVDKIEKKPRKPPSKDAPVRWFFFVVYAVMLCSVTITMIILIAF